VCLDGKLKTGKNDHADDNSPHWRESKNFEDDERCAESQYRCYPPFDQIVSSHFPIPCSSKYDTTRYPTAARYSGFGESGESNWMLMDAGAALLRALPPETAHKATLELLRVSSPFLPNPIGLAAGFDKDAEVPDAMLKLGFGFVECGSITPRAQIGNPRPRLFRLTDDRAVINRMGFNNRGMERAAARLAKRARKGILGINIGANKDSTDRIGDYRLAFERLAPFADYIAINVSSPNTPGLRGLQNKDELARLLGLLTETRATMGQTLPLLLKIAPDIDEAAMDDIANAALTFGIEGLIVGNTTLSRPASLRSAHVEEAGGLSGAPLFDLSTAVLRAMRARTASKLVLVGVGGVSSGQDAYAKIRAGASLVQLYTALAYRGPGMIARIKNELLSLLASDGFTALSDAVGADLR
jgi:dihydroorotate dehydrogenase